MFDTVGSTGIIPGNNIDLGHDFKTTDTIGTIVHTTAEQEYRNLFNLQSVRCPDGTLPANAQETVYPGAHADNGGDYKPGEDGKSNELSNIALRDMYEKAKDIGIKLADIPEKYKVSPELDALYNNYRHAQSQYRATPTKATEAAYKQAYDDLAKDYIHDSRPFWKQSGIFEDTERDIFYPNAKD